MNKKVDIENSIHALNQQLLREAEQAITRATALLLEFPSPQDRIERETRNARSALGTLESVTAALKRYNLPHPADDPNHNT